jgi:hypothetical protein
MNLKSLLLGSAAMLAAVSGARAADAVVAAEPEPLEYVRICDAYGAGYFFIPGTETCLKIGGMVRSDGQWYNAYDPDPHWGTFWKTRAELNFDTATDTEYGALKTETILRFNAAENKNDAQVLWAYIQLGGFLVGKTDSQYNQFIGYAGNVINDDVIGDGPYELNQITYLYDSGSGFTGVISLEDTASGNNAFGPNGEDASDHYAPNVVAGVGYKAGMWGFKLVGGYDSIVEEGAISARIDADFGSFKAFVRGAWNTDGDKINEFANGERGGAATTGDWAVWAGTTVDFSDKLQWNTQLAYADNKTFEATTNINYFVTKGFKIQPEITYVNYDKIDEDVWAGVLRFQRTF